MAGTTPIYGLPYPQSSDLVSAYPALGQDLAEDLDGILAAKANYPSAGSDGQALVKSGTDTAWASLTAGLNRVTTASLSGSATSVNNCFTSAAENYRIIVDPKLTSGQATLSLRMRASGADNSTSNYYYSRLGWTALGAASNAQTNSGADGLPLCSTLAINHALVIDIANPQSAKLTTFVWQTWASNGSNFTYYTGGGEFDSTAQFDGFSLYVSASTFASGSVRVYSYAN
jgi:hypothetical protein